MASGEKELQRTGSCEHRVARMSFGGIVGFANMRGTLFGVPIIGTVEFCGLFWGPVIWGNYHSAVASSIYSKLIGKDNGSYHGIG